MVNVDSLLHDIHLLWDDMETNDIVELQAKKLDNVGSKKDPHVMLIDDILLEKKFRDTMLVFMNDKTADIKRKCKEVSGSHTIIKKRCQKKHRQTTYSPSMAGDKDSSNVWENIRILYSDQYSDNYMVLCIHVYK